MIPLPETPGPFRIVRRLDTGGMSRVFLAERVRDFSQQVVIKFGNMAEAEILASLRHEHIVQLLGSGASDDGEYLVIEYVNGAPIDEFCRVHASSLDQRLELLEQLAAALGYAHRHLIIHADLKPSNVLVTNGNVKVLDFGIAQRAGMKGGEFYTPLYASPEQREGKPLSAATDIFLLGKLAAELLQEWLNGDLAAIVQKATAPRAEDRYASVELMRGDIAKVRRGEATSVRELGRTEQAWRWVRRTPFVAAGLALGAVVVAIGSWEIVVHHARAVDERRLADRQLQDLVRLNGVLAGDLYAATGSLQGAEGARVKLRSTALETLNAIAPNAKDRKLRVELASQYGHIAELQIADRLQMDAVKTAQQGLQILDGADRALQGHLEELMSGRGSKKGVPHRLSERGSNFLRALA